ncbi:MAG: hypothetical protein IKW46_07365 [Bacteroidaceae bacterium]|nr:hypothetical protein [Bacteroidaceae bacterium]
MLVKSFGRGESKIRVIYPERILASVNSWFINVVEFHFEDDDYVTSWFNLWDQARVYVQAQTDAGRHVAEYIADLPIYGLRWLAAHEYNHIQVPALLSKERKYRWVNYYDKQELLPDDRLRVPEPWKVKLFGEWWLNK